MKTFTQVALAVAVGVVLIYFVRCSRERRAYGTSSLSIRTNAMPTNVMAVTAGELSLVELGRRAATAGLALGINNRNASYEHLSNVIREAYLGKNAP